MTMLKSRFTFLLFLVCLLVVACDNRKSSESDDVTSSPEKQNETQKPANPQYFILQVPELEEKLTEYCAVRLRSYRLCFVEQDGKRYLTSDVEGDAFRLSSKLLEVDKTNKGTAKTDNRFSVSTNKNKEFSITGYVYEVTGGMIKYELKGREISSNQWEGTGIASLGAYLKISEIYDGLYNMRWRLFPENKLPDEDANLYQVTLTRNVDGIAQSFRDRQKTNAELLAMQKFDNLLFSYAPPIALNGLTRLIREPVESKRLQRFGNSKEDKERKLYARDKILPDFGWSELPFLPPSIVLVDHLATVEKQDIRDELARRYCNNVIDNSGQFVIGKDLASWTKVPLLFLLVHYVDWLTHERMEKLAASSKRMSLLMAEIKKYGKDSPEHLDEIMVSVLNKMPATERWDYFVKSIRLRDYVGSSTNESLQKLLPNDLPPPPGPPENMRTWTVNGRKYVGAFVSVDIKSDFLKIIDSEREEKLFYFSDTSKEDQAYVKEQLAPKSEKPKTDSLP